MMLWTMPTDPQKCASLSIADAVTPWLDQAREGWAHGHDLTEIIARMPYTQAPRDADDLLVWWHHNGLVRPSDLSCPTTSQRTLGHGGRLMGYGGKGKPNGEHPPTWHHWKMCGPFWIRGYSP